ncbi:hypothetical protein LTR37_007753 [Vermiconidia calcicola]|uniref:Uncharacterized protein n=1 Tax=Vermiconidia calcicola TaxID=1690605 RepID=A0ACC3NCR7_9PEZI|nr:hypothetical protein LTR37_007753 [Vermiconidia calcicola]
MSATGPLGRPRHAFAPIGGAKNSRDEDSAVPLQGIVFDMDGTLCEPQNYMFSEMRSAVSIPKSVDILDHIHSLSENDQKSAFAAIQDIERRAMANQVPQAGLVSLMEFLDRHGVKKGICTRNFDAPVTHLLEKHLPSHIDAFHPIVTRDFRPPKPSPAGILHIAHAWGLTKTAEIPASLSEERPPGLIMVGDSIDDVISGYEAGAMTVLLRSEGKEDIEKDERTDVVVSRLDELIELLQNGIKSRIVLQTTKAD